MKKIIAIALAALMCFSLAACGGTASDNHISDSKTSSAEQAAVPADTDSTENADNTEENTNHPSPKVQDIRNFLALDTPYDVEEGTYGSMDFM